VLAITGRPADVAAMGVRVGQTSTATWVITALNSTYPYSVQASITPNGQSTLTLSDDSLDWVEDRSATGPCPGSTDAASYAYTERTVFAAPSPSAVPPATYSGTVTYTYQAPCSSYYKVSVTLTRTA
jgi:hypothetical protein